MKSSGTAAAPVAMGIDFGTTNSVVSFAFANGDVESLSWPSSFGQTDTFRTALMFWRGRDGRPAHAAGPEAIAKAIRQDGEQRFIQSIKTHLASPLFTETRLYGARFTIEQLVGIFLTHMLDGKPFELAQDCCIIGGRPVVFAGERPDAALAQDRLRAAFGLAGLKSVELAYEPLGAAYWYARQLERNETVLVADFGGGTSDFSVLKFVKTKQKLEAVSLAHSGVGIAGDTFDFRLVDHIVAPKLGKGTCYRSFEKLLPIPAYFHAAFAQWHQLSWLKSPQTLGELKKLASTSEAPKLLEELIAIIELDLGFELYRAIGALKVELSAQQEAQFLFDREGIKISASVTRADFESWIASDLVKITEAVDLALQGAGLEPEDIDAVFLTGGTSFVPSVRAIFKARFGEAKLHIGDAFQSVASGLALLALDRSKA